MLLASIGGLIGLLFGLCASVGEFCVRSAVLGMTEGSRRPQALAWLAAIGCAVISVQSAGALGLVDWSSARQVSSGGSLSGALTGGLMLGLGIGFARGCPSRQIVLASRGNLRSIATLIFIGIAVASSIDGALSSSVERISAIWPIGANSRTVSGLVGFGPLVGVVIGAAVLTAAVRLSAKGALRPVLLGGFIGGLVGITWTLSAMASHEGFLVLFPSGISFAGPLGRLLLALQYRGLNWPALDSAILVGTFIGALTAAVTQRKCKMVFFAGPAEVFARAFGGLLIGVGASAAGGCSLGALSGVAILSVTNIVALGGIGLGLVAYQLVGAVSFRRVIQTGRTRDPAKACPIIAIKETVP